ncbi:MAG: 16S rRNA (uracil(1498)-N(3))-methyltransferase [Lysobacterales bacterium]
MRQQRLYVHGGPTDGGWTLPDKRAHYLRRVLRLREGYTLTAFDGSGAAWEVRLADASGQRLEIIRELKPTPPCGLPVLLMQCVGRGERMDYALQKSTELGVSHIMPVLSERTEVRLSGERAAKRLAHWQGVITQACEQSGRNYLPKLTKLQPLDQAIGAVCDSYDRRMALAPTGVPLRRGDSAPQKLAVLIGPEGGLTDDEIEAASRHGFQATAFGPRILRTETAGPAVMAAAQSLWGDLAQP